MKTPIFVRSFSEEEREVLQAGLRSKDTFTLRRSQMLLASSRGEYAPRIAESLGSAGSKRCATPSMISTRGAWMLSLPDPRAPEGPGTPSTRRVLRLSKRCSTTPRGSSDTTRACGLWGWQHRRASRRGLRRGGYLGRPSGPPWRAFSEFAGREPSGGSPPLTPCMKEKKPPRPTDERGRSRSRHLGGGFPGRVLVEPGGSAHLEQLERGGKADAPHSTVGGQRRPRAEGRLLLRTLSART